MDSTPPTLTYTATIYGHGNARRVSISLPYIACIADDPHYREPLPEPEPEPPEMTRPSRWSKKLIRRTMGRDRENTAKLRNQIGYQAVLRRIDGGGV
jgi:hypothetical protein